MWLALSLLVALGVWASGGAASAQSTYVGFQNCAGGDCHGTSGSLAGNGGNEYNDYMQHGHAWMEVHTGGALPTSTPDSLFGFSSVGVHSLPPLPTGVTWAQVEDIVGNFYTGPGQTGGQGDLLTEDGILHELSGGKLLMPADCNGCHNATGFTCNTTYSPVPCPTPGPYTPMFTTTGNTTAIQGSWAYSAAGIPMNGVQCEYCHGPGNNFNTGMQIPTNQTLCADCHSTGDFAGSGGTWVSSGGTLNLFRIPVDLTSIPSGGTAAVVQFTNHHMEGDEFRRSPHAGMLTDQNRLRAVPRSAQIGVAR